MSSTWSTSAEPSVAGAAPTPAAKTERLLNLVIALLWTRRPLTKAHIRDAVPQYQQTASIEAFDRMFERDKDELRDLGIPLATALVAAAYDDELGYRIDRREYALPPVDLAPDEVTALALAARAWSQASLAGAASMALNKLRAAGVEIDERSVVGIEPTIRTAEPAFDAVRAALVARQVVSFEYRKPDGSAAARSVQPWGRTSGRGRWYLTGFDLDRGAERVFRLGRVVGAVTTVGKPGAYAVPADHRPRVLVAGAADASPPSESPAVIRLRGGAGQTLRRRAVSEVDDAGWTTVTLASTNLERLADEVAGFGPEALAISPPELVAGVKARLAGALAAAAGPSRAPPSAAAPRLPSPRRPGWVGCSPSSLGCSTTRASRWRRRPRPSGSPRPRWRRTSRSSSSAAPPGTCPTTSSTRTGRTAGSSSPTPRAWPGRGGSPSTRH